MSIYSEFNLEKNRFIYDITKFTHLDYPQHLACIFWFNGCNMRCDYCYNKEIVFAKEGNYTYADALNFLHSRIKLLDAVVISGGEATTHNLVKFIQAIKNLGFLVKLDTNGTSFESIKILLEKNLLDYIALDYKAPQEKFHTITHSQKYEEFSKTLNHLIHSNIKFEVRTTLHEALLNENDINNIINDLHERGYKNTYYIQEFFETQSNIANLKKSSISFNKELLKSTIAIEWR
ncbi:anaerobic ribonucleoside-triphosphate reductase activating protein [Sulfurimonas sp.]